MARAYKRISKKEFDSFFKFYDGIEFSDELYRYLENSQKMREFWSKENSDPEFKEYIYLISLTGDYGILVYSSVDKRTGCSRDCGDDAIRFVAVNFDNLGPIGKSYKALRIATWRSNFIKNVNEIVADLGNNMKCENCGGKMILRRSEKTKKNFLGCENYIKNGCKARDAVVNIKY